MAEVVKPTAQYWRGRRVLVTGHTGFKGSWLSLWLAKLGAEVYGVALEPRTPSLFESGRVDEVIERSWLRDIRDQLGLSEIVRSIEPDVVFHLAAQPLVRQSYHDPIETFSTNVMGTANLLEACREAGHEIRAIVVVTSDKCYENTERLWGYREGEALGGRDPYSASKACTELVAAAYGSSFFSVGWPRVATARAGNVVGGGDWSEDRLVPDVIRALQGGLPVVVRYPRAIRPWQHVLEPLSGYLLLAEQLLDGSDEVRGAWNFGPMAGDEWRVADVVDFITGRWPGGGRWLEDAPSDYHEAGVLRLDSTKARTRLGWRPRLSTEEAFRMTVDWYVATGAGADPRTTVEGQIDEFTQVRAAVAT